MTRRDRLANAIKEEVNADTSRFSHVDIGEYARRAWLKGYDEGLKARTVCCGYCGLELEKGEKNTKKMIEHVKSCRVKSRRGK